MGVAYMYIVGWRSLIVYMVKYGGPPLSIAGWRNLPVYIVGWCNLTVHTHYSLVGNFIYWVVSYPTPPSQCDLDSL